MEKEADSPSVCGSEEAGYLKTELFKQKTRFTSYIHRILLTKFVRFSLLCFPFNRIIFVFKG